MAANVDRFKADLDSVIERGRVMLGDLSLRAKERDRKLTSDEKRQQKQDGGVFERDYQKWYTEVSAFLHQMLPARAAEFDAQYHPDARRKVVDGTSFAIQDWMLGRRAATNDYSGKLRFDDLAAVTMRFHTQLEILIAAEVCFKSSLMEVKQVLQADIFDNELDASRELHRNGYYRAAGVLAGVVLEGHLAAVCASRQLVVKKKSPTIGDLNDVLKDALAIEVPTWRFIQRLGDIRNVCGHKKTSEPTKDDVDELMSGTDRITKTLY